MKRTTLALVACAIVVAPLAQAQFFQSGNIVVSRVGDGTNPLVNTGNPVSLLQFAPDGTLINQVDLPSTGVDGILSSGTATSEGHLTLTADGRFLLYYGYNAGLPNGTVLNSSSGAAIPRTVVRVDAFGNINSSTRLTDAQSGQNPRSAASPDGVRFYTAGGSGGVRLAQLGATTAPTQVNTGNVNLRVIQAINGNLYYSTASASPDPRGIYKVQSYPFNAGAVTTQVANTDTAGTSSPYGFAFANNDTVLYVADDRNNINGGIQRFDLGQGGFTFSYVISLGSGVGARAVTRQGNTLFAITTDNRLVSFEDVGPSSPVSTLATGGSNFAFRGVAPAPNAPKAAFVNFSTGRVGLWNMQGASVTSSALASIIPTGWDFVGFGDFTGNKSSDLLFYNSSTNQIGAWFMTGTIVTGLMLYTIPAGWAPRFTGDFNGDGNSDIVFTNPSGQLSGIWLMNGRNVIGSRIYSTGNYIPVFAADLNGLGKDFLVWYNNQNMVVWQMDGLNYVATNVYSLGPNFILKGTGDFNLDNRQDIVVVDGPNDSLQILFMDGVLVDSSATVGSLGGFSPVAFPRFTHSGRSDILLQNATTQQMRIWIMNGSNITDSTTFSIAGSLFVGTNDFNRDGRDDIMTGSGSAARFYLMEGTTILQQATIGFSGSWLPLASPSL